MDREVKAETAAKSISARWRAQLSTSA